MKIAEKNRMNFTQTSSGDEKKNNNKTENEEKVEE